MKHVAVIGCGTMGSGIAQVALASGCDVTVVEASADLLRVGTGRLLEALDRAVAKGRLTEVARSEIYERARFTTDLASLGDREIVIEAVVEDEAVKAELFGRIDAALPPDAVLATNTSSFPIGRLASSIEHADRFLGMHFFNPAPAVPLVELTPSLLTSPGALERARSFVVDHLGMTSITCQDRAGFVVNNLLLGLLLSAVRMLEGGYASAAEIDEGMRIGCGHPMGPLALADMVGLDTMLAVSRSLHGEFHDPAFAAPPLLLRMVEVGRLGRKTGRGFYDYST